jgi:hydroxyacylglutathione hydrolase
MNPNKNIVSSIRFSAVILFFTFFGTTPKSMAQTAFVERVFDESLAQTSYLIANLQTKEAIVIDPKRDIDTYLEIARKHNFRITKVTETHIHADFLSGTRELVSATGAELLLSGETDSNWAYEFPHSPLKDGDKISMGEIVLTVMHTPGHTPESLTFLLMDQSVSDKPQKAFTGDFVFVGDVGRPDLLEKVAGQIGSQDKGAKSLYASLQRFSKLPDELEIWPGHGAGSFCGKSLSSVPQSTLKIEKATNKAFQFHNDEKGFVKYILDGQPEPPKYFAVMKQWNREPRSLLVEVPKYYELSKEEFSEAQRNGLIIIDTRKKEVVANGYIPGSLHIEGSKSFSTFMGWLLDYEQQYVLIADKDEIEDLTRKLMRIGMDNMYGYITDVNAQGQKLEKFSIAGRDDLLKAVGTKTKVIDVRTSSEFNTGHVKGAENIALASLEDNLAQIKTDKAIIVHCKSGTRAAMAYSILKKYGYKDVRVYLGDIKDITESPQKH